MISLLNKISLNILSSIGAVCILQAQEVKQAPLNVAQESITGEITFFNGDSVTGKIDHWDIESIIISSPDLLDPIHFSTAEILHITLQDQASKDIDLTPTDDETTLYINHRDNQKGLQGVIKGGFSNIDDDYVTLETNYSDKIKVEKKFITKMEINSKKGYLYQGPLSLSEWHDNGYASSWEYKNKSLISGTIAGNIAQDMKLPDEVLISFDLSWKNDEHLSLNLFSSDHEQASPDDYYKLNLQRGRCSLYKYLNGDRKSQITSIKKRQDDPFRNRNRTNININKRHAHYELYLSKSKGVFHIYRDGIELESFKDSNPAPREFGSALHLLSANNTPIRIKNLNISPWSGYIPTNVDSKKFETIKGEGERILLNNGDVLLGKIAKVSDGVMQVETLYTPLSIPIVRMRSIDLTGSSAKVEPIKYQHDIKCWFKDSGWIILKPISVENNILTAHHQALGKNTFNLNVFKRIDLHIYNNNANTTRKVDSW